VSAEGVHVFVCAGAGGGGGGGMSDGVLQSVGQQRHCIEIQARTVAYVCKDIAFVR
jgi:hypothetical protein